jgi:hypothetical protein
MSLLSKPERILLWALLSLTAFAIFGPYVAQPLHHHDFADRRTWTGIPNAMDVLSNLPFALWGAAGLIVLLWRRVQGAAPRNSTQIWLAATFFMGLILTAGASSCYHLQPTDASLLIDRLGMVIVFAGLLGLAGANRVSARAGVALAGCVLLAGPISVVGWSTSGNVLPWLVVQFGGLLLIASVTRLPSLPGTIDVRWGWIVLIYLVAKLLEMSDAAVFEISEHGVSGHSLKHAVAGFAAWPVLSALMSHPKSRAESAEAGRRVAPDSHAV